MKTALPSLALGLSLSLTAQAQTLGITYIDADCSVNTTLADGTPYAPQATTANDNEWNARAFANGGTILSSNDIAGNENAPMLRTTISGLLPGVPHQIYAYFWGVAGAAWRGRVLVSDTQPAPELPGYVSVTFTGTTFTGMQPLAFDSPIGPGQTSLGLTYDAAGMAQGTHFSNQVMLHEGNRWLFEVPLGSYLPNQNGEVTIYVDDLANQGNGNRTWYDGVGYEWAPLSFGNGCGAPAPEIGYIGRPNMNSSFTVTMSNGPASNMAILVFGLSNVAWSGGPLPQSLAFAGFPGCDLLVSPDVNSIALTDPNGFASSSIFLSGVPQLDLYWQWAALTPSSLAFSAGLRTSFHE